MTVQYKRKATLIIRRPGSSSASGPTSAPVVNGSLPRVSVTGVSEKNLDLSEFHFIFKTTQADVESPNTAVIRIFNLADSTVASIQKAEYTQVVLQAGYEGAFGVIFQGEIRNYGIGRESATTKYLDIYAADGDLSYNYGIVNKTLAGGNTAADRIAAAVAAMTATGGVTVGYTDGLTGGVLPRGKVLFALPRVVLSQVARTTGTTWHVLNNKVNIVPLEGYMPGEAVVLNHLTGMIGLPQQTEQGLVVKTLLNPRIVIGTRVQIDNKSVNQLVKQNPANAPVAYNSYTGLQLLATVVNDGFYRVLVAEHEGDTRGAEWYTNVTCLALDPSSGKVTVK